MKRVIRVGLQTTVAAETKAGLQKIAKQEKLSDHGLPSKGQAIDYLVNNYFVIKAGKEVNNHANQNV